MLKIKDNLNLKELEKYGFKYIDGDYYYDFIPYEENDYSYLVVDEQTKELIIDYVNLEHFNKATNILYNLIKDNLVEKVEE